MTLSPGVRLGPYEIRDFVGAGGMGEVYRAHDLRLARDVALKVLTEGPLDSAEMLARFQREAQTIASLSHPHIARLYDLGQHAATHYLVMEFLEGETLARRLYVGRLPVAEAIRYAAEIADALEFAHHAGVVHRDLKPANVILTAGGAKLLDFGLAKLLRPADDGATDATRTDPGRLMGTYRYMAPEQFAGGEIDARTDIFALGVVLFEMITGQRPFTGATVAAIAAAVLHDDAVPVSRLESSTPAALDRVIRKCLAKDPDERWPSAGDVRDHLRAIRLASGRPAPAATHDSSSRHRAPSRVRGVAVLPLRNLSGDNAEDYVADGLTDALITSLAKIGALKVISRTSVMGFKDNRRPLREIARELKVDTILEGSVTRSQGRIGINVQLVRAATDSPIWAERYHRDFTDILEVQGEVAQAVADAVRVTVTPGERALLEATPKVIREAHDEYLRGQFAMQQRTREGLEAAVAHFNRAIERDPRHALAHVGLARYFLAAGLQRLLPYREAFSAGRRAATEAIRLDRSVAAAHAIRGRVAAYEWDLATAKQALEQALLLDPYDSATRQACAWHWMFLGRFDEAIAHAEVAQEVDPRSPGPSMAAAYIYYTADEPRRALLAADRAILLAPESPPAHYIRSLALAELARWQEAVEAMQYAVDRSRRQPITLAGLVMVLARRGTPGDAAVLVDELERRSVSGDVTPFDLAEVYAALGDADRALQHLDDAREQRMPELTGIAVEPVFAGLRPLPAFRQLLTRIGLEPHPS